MIFPGDVKQIFIKFVYLAHKTRSIHLNVLFTNDMKLISTVIFPNNMKLIFI